MRRLPIFYAVAAVVHAQNGMIEQGKEEIGRFQAMAPGFVPNMWAELDRRNIPYEAQLRFVEGMEKLGVNVPPRPARSEMGDADAG
jgi:adenylate cyclase